MKIYSSINDRLRTQHHTIWEIVKNVSTDRIIKRPAPYKWNIHDNIAHLAKYQLTFIERINIILKEDVPHFGRYRAEDDPDFETFRNRSGDDLIKCLNAERIKLIELVLNLSDDDLKRTGIHKKYGPLSIIQWIEFFLLHEAHHLFTIFQLANDIDLK